jgi:DNA-binding transcriptional ArsR family regulator
VLRALADPTRLRILRQVTLHPRSTQELAPIVGLSEAGTSKHLRLLAAAGLLETHREGYYVLYSLASKPLDGLGGDLRHYIHSRAAR